MLRSLWDQSKNMTIANQDTWYFGSSGIVPLPNVPGHLWKRYKTTNKIYDCVFVCFCGGGVSYILYQNMLSQS